MKLSQIRHFVGLADELHFGRAAERLGIAQPPFSQSIQRLEAGLGYALVDRSESRVALTPAGQVFAREARIALRQLQVVEQAAASAARGEVAELRIGFVEPALFRIIPTILAELRKALGNGGLRLVEKSSLGQVEALQRGDLDLGFVLPQARDFPGVETRLVESSRLVACLAADSPLAQRRRLRLADLADQPFILIPPEVQPASHEAILSACRRAGFSPRVEQQSLNALTMISLVAHGLGIAFLPENAERSPIGGVVFRRVEGLPDIRRDLVMAWRRDQGSERLRVLIERIGALCEPCPTLRRRQAEDVSPKLRALAR